MINPANQPVPTQSTPGGGTRRYVLDDVIITNGSTGAYSQNVASVRMTIPSTRLMPGLSLCYRPVASEDTSFPSSGAGAWLLTLDAWKRTSSGMWLRSNNIITDLPIPTTYEVGSTTVDAWRGTVTVPTNGEGGTGIVPGLLYAIATWEPVQGDNISDEELSKLFQSCALQVSGIFTTQSGGE